MKRIVLLVTVFLLAGAAAGAWWWAHQSIPPLDGEQRLSGLTGPVEVLFDGYGVPHVYATSPDDAWMAAGMLHARERLWQMELYRRAAYGRLSEVLGAETLPIDKRMLTLGLKAGADAEWAAAGPAVRNALTKYTEGINAQIASATGAARPLEFQLLRFDPAPWKPVDSLVVGRLLAWRLAENHRSELVRAALAARFGASEAQRLGGTYPADAPTILGGIPAPLPAPAPANQAAAVSPAAVQDGGPPAAALPPGLEWLDPGARRGLSNNFVVAPSRTATGRPLLANDPHLQMEFPSVWYEMHLVAAGLDVMGVTVPGTPFVIIGHNQRIAWGVTNTGADVQDLYVDRIDLGNERYFWRGQWFPADVTSVEIPVKGRAAEPFEVWRTRHGAVFADTGLDWLEPPGWLAPTGERSGERRAYTLRWDIRGEMAGAFEQLDRASNWAEFTAAVERFAAPSQNFVYADVDGNIGYAMSGELPLRGGGNGMWPVDGTTGDGEWAGRLDPTTLPRAFNPPAGWLTSSNNEIDRSFRGLITRDWAAPFRATRLAHAMALNDKLSVNGAAQLQNDVVSNAAEHVLAHVQQAIDTGKRTGAAESAVRALEQLRFWDHKVDARPVVALYEAFEHALWRRTFADEMGDELFEKFYEWAGAERPSGLYAIVDDRTSRWFEDIGTIDRHETRDDIYLLAAQDAVDRLDREYGDRSNWDWSAMHAATFAHPISSGGFVLRWLFNRGPSKVVGDGTTVMRVSFNRLRPFAAWELPSWRQVLDVGNWDESRVVLPAGQSGHPLSPHYFDQNEMWRQGQTRPQPYTRAAVDRVRAHRLVLVP